MDFFTDRSIRINNLKLQGSDLPFDDELAVIDEIVLVGEEIHEGWNYYDLSTNPRKYRYYRMFNE
jgi:hypothetical protein